MPIEISNPGDIAPRSTGILWGPSKSGKTTLLMTLPGRKLIINVDPDGWTSVAKRKDMQVMDLSVLDFDETIRFGMGGLAMQIEKSDFGEGDSLIFDSATSYGQCALQMAVKNKIGESRKSGFIPTIEEPGISAYGARTQYIVTTVRNLLRATAKKRMHCWVTSHEDTPTTNDKGDFLYQSMLMSENAVNQTGLAVSEIWYLSKMDKVRRLAIAPCRGKKPMGSRMFTMESEPEFVLKYDTSKPNTQPHSISTWWSQWLAGDKTALELPK